MYSYNRKARGVIITNITEEPFNTQSKITSLLILHTCLYKKLTLYITFHKKIPVISNSTELDQHERNMKEKHITN